jgi:hypothetical protein
MRAEDQLLDADERGQQPDFTDTAGPRTTNLATSRRMEVFFFDVSAARRGSPEAVSA